MYKQRIKLLCITALFTLNLSSTTGSKGNDIWIIVHGTFAQNAAWHQSENDFFKTLVKATQAQVYGFTWSGKLSAIARRDAGIALKDFIISIVHPHDRIHIIAHSHGGNVAMIAATYLSQTKSPHVIHELILLGTPIPIKLTTPDMERIKRIYNFFSYGDKVQPVLQRFKRVFADHPRIFNIQLKVNNRYPLHTGLHTTLIAHHAPRLQKLITHNHPRSLVINILSQEELHIEHDVTREQDLKVDSKLIETLLETFADPYRTPSQLTSTEHPS